MAVALGKEVPLRALAGKTDNVAVLPLGLSDEEEDSLVNGTWLAKWKPEVGHWYTAVTENGEYWVVPDLNKPDRFHVSRLFSEDGQTDEYDLCDANRWAESADTVELRLKHFKMVDPVNVAWKFTQRAGLTMPFGAPENHGKIKVVGKDGQERWVRDAS